VGRQIHFWMLAGDEKRFVDFVLADPAVVMIHDHELAEPCLEALLVSELPQPPVKWWWNIYFWPQAFLFEPTWVRIREGDARGKYCLDTGGGLPLVEFTRSIPREEGELKGGRLWAKYGSDVFMKWYDRLARWIRRHYHRVEAPHILPGYAGPEAYEWHQAGGTFLS